MTARIGWYAALALFASCNAQSAEEVSGSVLVTTQAPQRGSVADVITAYGTASRAFDGGMTLSVPSDGRVVRVTVAPGEFVQRGQELMKFRLSAAATSAYAQAASALKLAKLEQEHFARLRAQQLATRDQMAQAEKTLADAEAALAALDAEQGGKSDQIITAPFDAVVGAIPVLQGDRVPAGAALVTLTRSGGLIVATGVEPADRSRVKPGQRVRLEPLSSGGQSTHGKIVRVAHALNPRTRLVDVDVAANGELLQGEVFRVNIEVGELKGWLVPRDAVLSDEQGEYLFQADKGKALRVAVRRIGGNDDVSVVDGPVDPGRPLVTAGNYQLSDGAAVRENAATQSRPATEAAPATAKVREK